MQSVVENMESSEREDGVGGNELGNKIQLVRCFANVGTDKGQRDYKRESFV